MRRKETAEWRMGRQMKKLWEFSFSMIPLHFPVPVPVPVPVPAIPVIPTIPKMPLQFNSAQNVSSYNYLFPSQQPLPSLFSTQHFFSSFRETRHERKRRRREARRAREKLTIPRRTFRIISNTIKSIDLQGKFEYFFNETEMFENPDMVRLVSKVGSASVWGMLGAGLLGTIGFDLTPLIAGVSVTGLTVGFAAKDISATLMSGFLILLHKPFNKGDYLIVDGSKNNQGIVDRVDLRYTYLWQPVDSSGSLTYEVQQVDRFNDLKVPNNKIFGGVLSIEALDMSKLSSLLIKQRPEAFSQEDQHILGFSDSFSSSESDSDLPRP